MDEGDMLDTDKQQKIVNSLYIQASFILGGILCNSGKNKSNAPDQKLDGRHVTIDSLS